MNIVERWILRRSDKLRDERLLEVEKIYAEVIDGRLSAEAIFGGPAAKLFAACMVQWFKETGGINFVTCDLVDDKTGEGYSLTMQKRGGKSPTSEIGELRAKVAELSAAK